MMLTRFAPSPTGYLHVGNIRTALLCYLYARKAGGKFMLRIDDTDTERSKPEYVEALKEDLRWLGLDWDVEASQSSRMDAYRAAVEKLKMDGRLYACYETQEELEIKRKMQLSRGLPPIYDRAATKLTDAERAAFQAEGRSPHWRFLLDDQPSEWVDEIRGQSHFEAKHMSDPILVRENGMFTYMLPSTVDDIEFKVSHVLRGEDHVSNTAIQLQIFRALGGKIPTFAHNALLKSREGKLSKRTGASSIRELREEKILPMAVASFLAKAGTSDPVEVRESLAQLMEEFDIHKFGRAPTLYEEGDIMRLNTKLLHGLSLEDAQAVFPDMMTTIDMEFWEAVRPNLESINDIDIWKNICKQVVGPDIEDKTFTAAAAEILPPEPWDGNTWKIWVDAVKTETGHKGKALFMPIRKALTGMDHGPELHALLPLIGREKAKARLNGLAA